MQAVLMTTMSLMYTACAERGSDMNTIDRARAEAIARETIAQLGSHDFVLRESMTEDRVFGWVFFYAPKRYLETGEKRYLVPGVGPIVVLRDGTVEHLATSMPPDAAISAYEADWNDRHGK